MGSNDPEGHAMTLTTYDDLEQGSEAWLAARCGIVTASVVGQLVTPSTLKVANNDTARALTMHLVAERITGNVEESFTSIDMERGQLDEPIARWAYSENYAPVDEVGFMARDDWGYRIGYSPDGLVGDDGLIEIKSRRQKKHLATILEDRVPPENMAQLQCALLVSGRKWGDYVSFCGGMPLWTTRVLPDPAWHEAIIKAVAAYEDRASIAIEDYQAAIKGLPATERTDHYREMSS
jgi:hypothetical protein